MRDLQERFQFANLIRRVAHAKRAAAEKPLTGSTVTPSNIQTDTNVQPFSAPNGRNRAMVKWCNREGETGRRDSDAGCLLQLS